MIYYEMRKQRCTSVCFLGEERFSVEYKFQDIRLDHCTHSASLAFLLLGG